MSIQPEKQQVRAFTSSLKLVATNYAYRCDAKFANKGDCDTLNGIQAKGSFRLGDFLPLPFVKGAQPESLDQPTDDSVPVINTLSIQNLSLNERDCRHISREDFDDLSDERRLKKDDVLLTVDGGVSIGKPYLFDRDGDFTVDSHVVVLRPSGLSPLALVYLLASPLGQMQFRRAESGASGQTTVTEDDVRRFIFPKSVLENIDALAKHIEGERRRINVARLALQSEEELLWTKLSEL